MRHHLHLRRKDRLVGLLLVLWIGWALAACGATLRPEASPNSPASAAAATAAAAQSTPTTIPALASQGVLAGQVVAGPTCPVERAEDPCPPRPVPNRVVLIELPVGTLVAKAMTDAHGQFQVALAPGVYMVNVPGGGGLAGGREGVRVQATVHVGQVSHVKLELDTGIR
jgi:hypothetical protein